MSELTYTLVLARGYWGRGETLEQAVEAAEWIYPGTRVVTYKAHPKTHVNEMGFITFPAGHEPEKTAEGILVKGRLGRYDVKPVEK